MQLPKRPAAWRLKIAHESTGEKEKKYLHEALLACSAKGLVDSVPQLITKTTTQRVIYDALLRCVRSERLLEKRGKKRSARQNGRKPWLCTTGTGTRKHRDAILGEPATGKSHQSVWLTAARQAMTICN